MKWIFAVLVALFLVLQYRLWFGQGGVTNAIALKKQISKQQKVNAKLDTENSILVADIKVLKQNPQTIEAEARSNLGMIKKGETFYQVVS